MNFYYFLNEGDLCSDKKMAIIEQAQRDPTK